MESTEFYKPSAKHAFDAVQALASDPTKSLIVVRQAEWWKVGEGPRIVPYMGSQGRGGYFIQAAKDALLKPWA